MNAYENGIIDIDDVSSNNEKMENKKILKQHKYEITPPSYDNRWRTYVEDLLE